MLPTLFSVEGETAFKSHAEFAAYVFVCIVCLLRNSAGHFDRSFFICVCVVVDVVRATCMFLER